MIHNIKDSNSIKVAGEILINGGIIIYPTDTLYGFGVDATNTKAIEKLNILKKRKQVYSIIVNSLDMLKKYAIIEKNYISKISNYLPGAYTLILNKRESNLSHLVSLNLNTIGIRIPMHNFPLKIVENVGRPIITTSVNIHNQKSLYKLSDIKATFNKVDIFYDESINSNSNGSTILDFSKSKIEVLRKGDGVF